MSEKKVVSIEERIPKLKHARKKKANRRLVFYLSVFFILISVVVYLQSPLSNIRNVSVEGNQFVSDEELKSISELASDDNFWSVDKEAVKNRIEEHPVIEEVDISKQFPSTIRLQVKEYDRVGYVENEGAYFPVLENGKRLTTKTTKVAGSDAPILIGFNNDTYLKEMTKELQILPDSIVDLISEIHWSPSDENPYVIQLFMNDGYQVDGSIRSFSEKMMSYPSIVAQLDPGSEGIIHIGVGAYFESYEDGASEGQQEDGENQDGTEG
ncbi:cell division protein FtsQ/DivIB [Sediminibacillus massiliensis]|uniref:cell division protein FtsQ/DivIB n=1 Tax=Sediminibacillus massiliensis TaxID=1926277 RepID=UPI00098847DD|nr:cell division protein FtsQ/DivIB [Sediminibacillus massiliensis]